MDEITKESNAKELMSTNVVNLPEHDVTIIFGQEYVKSTCATAIIKNKRKFKIFTIYF